LNPNGAAFSVFERTIKFDNIVKIISRNRRFLLHQFTEIALCRLPINFERVKAVLCNLLGTSGIVLDAKFWPLLISFAEKDGRVDFKYMLDRYKERTTMINLHPAPVVKNNFV
jgi:hypothetical protein